MLSKTLIFTGVIFLFLLVILRLLWGRKKENLVGTCPEGCISTNPNPCPYGYKIHPETLMCAPESTIPK